MAILKDKRNIASPFSNEAQLVRVSYDFANDGGAIADYDVLEAKSNCLVELVNIDVKTAVTGGAGAVVDLGKGAGGIEFKSDLAAVTIAVDTQIQADTVGKIVELADTEKIVMGVEVGAITAGKVEFLFKVYSR